MKRWLALFVIAFAIFGVVAYLVKRHRTAETKIDLADTLGWISRTYNHGGYRGHGWETVKIQLYSVQGKPEYSTSRYHETLTSDGCLITIHGQVLPSPELPSNSETYSETFNLRDVDPRSIRVTEVDSRGIAVPISGDSAWVSGLEMDFSTTNDTPAILNTNNGPAKSNYGGIGMDYGAYALRFAKAFKHAVELCDGKASKF